MLIVIRKSKSLNRNCRNLFKMADQIKWKKIHFFVQNFLATLLTSIRLKILLSADSAEWNIELLEKIMFKKEKFRDAYVEQLKS